MGKTRFAAVGCSHGHLANKRVLRGALRFMERWQPQTRIHLGDFTDLAALRSGAGGTKDEAEDIKADLLAGLSFLTDLAPQHIFYGNHEDRLNQYLSHPNAMKRLAAQKVTETFQETFAALKAQVIPYGIREGWLKLGDCRFGHGYMFGENAIKEHAESVGKCVIAHLHRVGAEPGRVLNGAMGYCVGTLADIPAMGYAKARRATLRWSHGLAYGEYDAKSCTVHLCEIDPNGNWSAPI